MLVGLWINYTLKQDFMRNIQVSQVYDSILMTIKDQKIQIVLKYHLFLTLKKLIENDCINPLLFNHMIKNLIEPQVSWNNQVILSRRSSSLI